MSAQPGLTLAMIVKNEEARLPRALASARPWVDEIVVVDTGSTDRTMAIAREAGARVYEHPWQHNFALHRNQANSYARGRWILILDADEELDQTTAPLIRPALAQAEPEVGCFLINLYNILADGSWDMIRHPRLFRNQPGFRYEGHVHNLPLYPGLSQFLPLKMYHYGYGLGPEEMQAKQERRLAMIRAWVTEEPGNWRAQYHWAQTLVADPRSVGAALTASRRAVELARAAGEAARALHPVYLVLLQGLTQEPDQGEEALRQAVDWQRLDPEHPDPYLYLARAAYQARDWPRALAGASDHLRLLAAAPGNPRLAGRDLNTAALAYSSLAMGLVSAAALGDMGQAREFLTRLLALPTAQEATRLALEEALKQGLTVPAAELARQLADLRPAWAWAAALAAHPRAPGQSPAPPPPPPGATALAQARRLSQAGRPAEALARLEAAVQEPPQASAPLLWSEIGFLRASLGQTAAAEEAYGRALALDPASAGACFNLAWLLARQGRQEEARQLLHRALAAAPDLAPARELLARLGES
ncbi:MAG: glycosyltransferase [Deltaproteobacteria bacterium]|nr:glycosyltransferase [Deltaproteobacteria bacterium]